MIGFAAGGRLKDRFFAISGNDLDTGLEVSAHGSYQQRNLLMIESIKAVVHYPLGIGMDNFGNYSGTWREVHVSYLQIAAEGGVGAFVFYILFFGSGVGNLRRLRRTPNKDAEVELFSGALYASLIGFVVGAFFAPAAYEYFPYFAVAYTSVLLAIAKEREQSEVPAPDGSNRPQPWWKERRARKSTSTRANATPSSARRAAPLRNRR